MKRLSPRLHLFPYHSPIELSKVGVAAPFLPLGGGQFRLPADEEACVAMETDEKRRPGLFETIIRRSIPLVVARYVSLSLPLALHSISLFLLTAHQLANRLRG